MTRTFLLLAFFGIFGLAACERETNPTRDAQRRYEDTLNLATILQNPTAPVSLTDFEHWLELYPEAAKQVNVREGTTAFGMVSKAYFQSEASTRNVFFAYFAKLLEKGADPNVLFPFGATSEKRGLIHLAAEQNDQAVLEFIIQQNGLAEPPPQVGCTASNRPQPQVAESGRIPLDINRREGEEGSGKTPLHYAVASPLALPQMTSFLLSEGANPNLSENPDDPGSTPLQLAASRPELLSSLELYSGAQLRFDSELRNYIDELLSIDVRPDNRLTVGSVDDQFQKWSKNPQYRDVVDFNRTIESCVSGGTLNLLGAVAQSFLADAMKLPLLWNARNKTFAGWLEGPASARVCDALVAIDVRLGQGTTNGKNLIRSALLAQNESASAALKQANKKLWCETIAPKAKAEDCWIALEDDSAGPDLSCL